MVDARPVLLIDFSALFRRNWHVASEQSHAFDNTIFGVNRARGMTPDALTVICCDGRGNWRKELAPTYKAQRESQPATMYAEMDRTIERLKRDGHLVWKFDRFEADDVIASAVMMACTRGHWCRIVSHDKDLLQLLSPATDYLAIHKTPWEVVGAEVVREKYGVDPEQLGDWLALVGDTSDNVQGCSGVGKGGATDLFKEHGSIDGMRAALLVKCTACQATGKNEKGFKCKSCSGTGDAYYNTLTPSVRKHLSAFLAPEGGFDLARKLVSLSREVPIQFDEIYETREIQSIDERDYMNEAEAEAEKYFGPKNVQLKEKAEVAGSELKDPRPESSASIAGETQPVEAENPIPTKSGNSPVASAVEQKKELARDVSDLGESMALISKSSGKTAETAKVQEKSAIERLFEGKDQPTEIATVEYVKQLEPRTFRETMIYATIMWNSRIYSRYPTPGSIAAAVVRGREMGFGAGASLDMFHVADFNQDGNLRLMMHAHLIIDLAMKDPEIEYFWLTETTNESCTYEAKVKRNPGKTVVTYTIEDARLAGLIKPRSNWEKRPRQQISKTCGVVAARIVSPGRTLGLYCAEEMGIDL